MQGPDNFEPQENEEERALFGAIYKGDLETARLENIRLVYADHVYYNHGFSHSFRPWVLPSPGSA